MATIGFTLTFWAWNLIAPMSGDYKERLGPPPSLLLAALTAIAQAFEPALYPVGTIALLCMAAGLGTASGSVFALVSR